MGAKKMALLSQKLCYVMALLGDRLLYHYMLDPDFCETLRSSAFLCKL